MTAYTIYVDQLADLLGVWSREYSIQVPVQVEGGFYDFRPWKRGVDIAWDYDLAYNNLKRFIMPQRETILEYDIKEYTARPVFDAPKQLLFGVHPYDVRAINQLDQIMEAGSPDAYYMKRRENTVIFAMEPISVADTAFWAAVGCDHVEHGFDLHWTKISPAAFMVQVGSQLGENLLLTCGDVQKSTIAEREAVRRAHARVLKMARRNTLKYPWKDTPKILGRSWNSPLWREKAESCLACGSCNTVCPTCYCFDIKEDVDENLRTGRRYREWDACMLEPFARVAGNHNFRKNALERYRHRYFRKGKYIYDMIGELGCVGCGRCVRACTARIANPLATFNQLWEAEQNDI